MKSILTLLFIGLFALYNLYLFLSGAINNYINERFFNFSFIASIITIMICVLGILFFVFKNRVEILENIKSLRTSSSFRSQISLILTVVVLTVIGIFINPIFILGALGILLLRGKTIQLYGNYSVLILVPLLVLVLGVVLPPQSLSSITAFQRESDFNSVSLASKAKNISGFSNTDNYELGDWIGSISYNPDLSYYKGKKVNVSGFIFVRDNAEDIFYVSRFVVTCCAVDARPVGLRVKANWREDFRVDDWVRVRGTFDIQNFNGVDDLVIIPETIEKIDEPDRPYIY